MNRGVLDATKKLADALGHHTLEALLWKLGEDDATFRLDDAAGWDTDDDGLCEWLKTTAIPGLKMRRAAPDAPSYAGVSPDVELNFRADGALFTLCRQLVWDESAAVVRMRARKYWRHYRPARHPQRC